LADPNGDPRNVAHDIAQLDFAGRRYLPYIAQAYRKTQIRFENIAENAHEGMARSLLAPCLPVWKKSSKVFVEALAESRDNLEDFGERFVQVAERYERAEQDLSESIRRIGQHLDGDFNLATNGGHISIFD
jgi:hypothetical protein